jgi:hypothetical protein
MGKGPEHRAGREVQAHTVPSSAVSPISVPFLGRVKPPCKQCLAWWQLPHKSSGSVLNWKQSIKRKNSNSQPLPLLD